MDEWVVNLLFLDVCGDRYWGLQSRVHSQWGGEVEQVENETLTDLKDTLPRRKLRVHVNILFKVRVSSSIFYLGTLGVVCGWVDIPLNIVKIRKILDRRY